MFKITQSPTFWSPVIAEVTDENGKKIEARWKQQFKRLTLAEVKEQIERMEGQDEQTRNREFLLDVTVEFKDVGDEDGQEVTDVAATVTALCEQGFTPAMIQAFYSGYPKAKAKN